MNGVRTMLHDANPRRSTWKCKYNNEEFARRADAIFEKIRAEVEPGNEGQVLFIDVETGNYATDPNFFVAIDRLVDGRPDAQIYCIRLGSGEWTTLHRSVLHL